MFRSAGMFRPFLLKRISKCFDFCVSCRKFGVRNHAAKPTSEVLPFISTEAANVVLNADDPIASSLQFDDFFQLNSLIDMERMFNSNVYLGHKWGVRNEFMIPYLYGCRVGVDIIDLNQTARCLFSALNFIAHIAFRGGIILFVSDYTEFCLKVENVAKECGEFSNCRQWREGLFTNSPMMFRNTVRLPDLMIFMNCVNSVFTTTEGLIESAKLLIPSVGIVDTNADPRLVTYPVPGNDDSLSSVEFFLTLFREAIIRAKQVRAELAKQRKLTE